jgi:hypothetical protein
MAFDSGDDVCAPLRCGGLLLLLLLCVVVVVVYLWKSVGFPPPVLRGV